MSQHLLTRMNKIKPGQFSATSPSAHMVHPRPPEGNWTIIQIASEWLVALGIALANHFFFSYLNGRDAGIYSDTIIAAARNAFATAVQLLLVFMEGIVLVQITWYYIRDKPIKLKILDLLFSLPQFSPFMKLAMSKSIPLAAPLLVMTTFIISMVSIPVFVPSSLSVGAANPIKQQIKVPVVDLQKDYNQSLISWGSLRPTKNYYIGVNPLLKRIVETTLSLSNPLALDPSGECSLGCRYPFSYDSIAMKCRDLDPSEIWSKPSVPIPSNITTPILAFLDNEYGRRTEWLFNASVTSDANNTADVYRYTVAYINYATWRTHQGEEPAPYLKGVTCTFHNASYSATAIFSNNTQTSITTPNFTSSDPILFAMPDCRPLPPGCVVYGGITLQCNGTIGEPPNYWTPNSCDFLSYHTKGLISTFTDAMSGTIVWSDDGGVRYNTTYPLASIFSSTVGSDSTYNSRAFGLSPTTEIVGLANSLEQLFANVTLSLMSPLLNQTNHVEVEAAIIPFATQYHYNPIPLVALYGFYLVGVLISVVFAFIALRRNGEESLNQFSRYITVTRDRTLDEAEEDSILVYQFEDTQNRPVFRMSRKSKAENTIEGPEPTTSVL